MTYSADEIAERIVQKTCQDVIPDQPFGYALFEDVFEESLFERLLDTLPIKFYVPFAYPEDSVIDGVPTRSRLWIQRKNEVPGFLSEFWREVVLAFRSETFLEAFRQKHLLDCRLAQPPLKLFTDIQLIRDLPGYKIHPHPDDNSKLITWQVYLTRGRLDGGADTVFYREGSDNGFEVLARSAFRRNGGYFFVRSDCSFHGVEGVPDGCIRDSLLVRIYSLGKKKKRKRAG